jgi:ATP-dependent Lon protease
MREAIEPSLNRIPVLIPTDGDYRHYWQSLSQSNIPLSITEKLSQELYRLQQLSPYAIEASLIKTYLDTVLSLPWEVKTPDETDLAKVAASLDTEHYGLEDVKERVLEFLAVQQLTQQSQGSILCLVGPPGVGKTSFAKSIAKSLGRPYAYVALGGIHDQSEIRGQRRTALGAMPGRIIQAIQQTGAMNPVIVLDEIEKMGSSQYGDPEAAMLELLDATRNHQFMDHYLDFPFDLSQVLFIATANSLYGMSRALRDRLEVIRISGYTDDEKHHIGQRFLLPRLLKSHGLASEQVVIRERVLLYLIDHYTREAGVRELERKLARICRKTAMATIQEPQTKINLFQPKQLQAYLGVEKFTRDSSPTSAMIGVVNGLAWTGDGGDILRLESNRMPGKGKLTFTGSIGNIMHESAQAAMSYIRCHADGLGLSFETIDHSDFHIHAPDGATPKDGPSAGIALTISLISTLLNLPVQPKVAMTGEVTIRGRILPIGGLKEKCLAAVRMKIKTILIPEGNAREICELPEDLRSQLTFIPIKQVEDAFSHIFTRPIQPEKAPKKNKRSVSR